ncbi:MAG: hypothetical protein V2B18_03665 [Pseudomonadota bacterium]
MNISKPFRRYAVAFKGTFMACLLIAGSVLLALPPSSHARGTRYFVTWPQDHIGPVYVQVYDIRVNTPYELLEDFKVWVTWDNQTKCYKIGNWGTYTLQLYKFNHCKGPMIISGNASSFKIRYSLTPPWI